MTALVQRETELAAIEAALDAAGAGTGGIVVIEGPAGIGKTALVRAARERALERGLRVLHARGAEFERDYPLGVVRQCLEPVLRGGGESLLRGPAQLAGPAILGIPEPVGASPVGLFHGLYWLVANLAEESPLLAAVDDAQWADEPSLRFLGYLARRLDALPIAVIVTARDAPSGPSPLDELRPMASRLEPRVLDVGAVRALLMGISGGTVDARFASECWRATSGNPFLLEELVRALRAEGVPFTAASSARVQRVTPPSVASLMARTLAALGPEASALAGARAILGEEAGLELAAELAGIAVEEAAAAAADLTHAGVLEDDLALQFRHPMLSAAVYAGLPARDRALAHARAAQLLRARGAGPDRIALQLLHAPPCGDPQVVADLQAAAERARERGAPATAAALLERALAEPPEPELRGELLLRLGRADIAAGEGRRAAAHLEEAYGCTRDPVSRGRAVELLSQSALGDLEHMRRWRELATAVLGDLEPRDPGLVLRLRAILLLGDADAAEIELTGATPDEAVYLAHLVLRRMNADARAADIADLALRAARHADALLEEGGYALAFASTVLALRWTDHVDAAEQLLERAIGSARRRGANADFAIAMTHRAVLARAAGRLRDAEADARAALAVELDAERGGFAQAVIPLLGTLVDQGRIDDARAELARGVGDQLSVEAPAMTALLLSRMAVLAACGDHAGALRDWDEALRRTRRTHTVNASWMDDLEVAVDVCASLGDDTRAAAITAQAQQLARAWDTPRALGQTRLAQARIAASDADRVELLREAVDALARGPARFQEARARVALGAALRRLGHRVDSRIPLREGYELARRCGSDGLAELARAELRASGIRLQRALVTGAEALTPSERRIADMAAGGLGNPEIAQALFLTVKTVEMHLTHAYRKLGIRARAELLTALATQA